MSDQIENEMQQTPTVTPEEVRQQLVAEIEATKQTITELNDEELEEVAGGVFGINRWIARKVIGTAFPSLKPVLKKYL